MPSWDLLWGEIYNLLDLDLRRSFLNHLVAMETVTIRLNQPFKLMEQIFIINYIALFRSDNSCIETSSNNSRVVQPEWCIGHNIGLHQHNLRHSKALHAEIVGISHILFNRIPSRLSRTRVLPKLSISSTAIVVDGIGSLSSKQITLVYLIFYSTKASLNTHLLFYIHTKN